MFPEVGGVDFNAHGHALDDLDPVAGGVLGRQEGEGAARPGGEAGHAAMIGDVAAVHVHADHGGLADAHLVELDFLEIGVDPQAVQGDHGHERGAGRYDFASLHAAFGDLPGGGAQDGGALEREPAVAHVGGGLAHGGLLGEPGIQQHGGKRVAFLFGGGERHGGILAVVAGVLQFFRANGFGLAQRLAPGQVVGFLAQIHPAHPDGGLGFPELRLKAAVVAHGGSQRHEGALIGKAGVHGIKAHERLPGGDHVVVVHIHGDDLAAHLRHDAQHIAGDIGVVRAFLKTQKQIPPRARAYPREQEQQKQEADDRALAGAFAPLRSLVVVRGHGKIFVCRHERLPRGAWFPELPLFSHVMGEIELTGQFYTTPRAPSIGFWRAGRRAAAGPPARTMEGRLRGGLARNAQASSESRLRACKPGPFRVFLRGPVRRETEGTWSRGASRPGIRLRTASRHGKRWKKRCGL